ncbi:unnamed protein product [Mortierella alpina]
MVALTIAKSWIKKKQLPLKSLLNRSATPPPSASAACASTSPPTSMQSPYSSLSTSSWTINNTSRDHRGAPPPMPIDNEDSTTYVYQLPQPHFAARAASCSVSSLPYTNNRRAINNHNDNIAVDMHSQNNASVASLPNYQSQSLHQQPPALPEYRAQDDSHHQPNLDRNYSNPHDNGSGIDDIFVSMTTNVRSGPPRPPASLAMTRHGCRREASDPSQQDEQLPQQPPQWGHDSPQSQRPRPQKQLPRQKSIASAMASLKPAGNKMLKSLSARFNSSPNLLPVVETTAQEYARTIKDLWRMVENDNHGPRTLSNRRGVGIAPLSQLPPRVYPFTTSTAIPQSPSSPHRRCRSQPKNHGSSRASAQMQSARPAVRRALTSNSLQLYPQHLPRPLVQTREVEDDDELEKALDRRIGAGSNYGMESPSTENRFPLPVNQTLTADTAMPSQEESCTVPVSKKERPQSLRARAAWSQPPVAVLARPQPGLEVMPEESEPLSYILPYDDYRADSRHHAQEDRQPSHYPEYEPSAWTWNQSDFHGAQNAPGRQLQPLCLVEDSDDDDAMGCGESDEEAEQKEEKREQKRRELVELQQELAILGLPQHPRALSGHDTTPRAMMSQQPPHQHQQLQPHRQELQQQGTQRHERTRKDQRHAQPGQEEPWYDFEDIVEDPSPPSRVNSQSSNNGRGPIHGGKNEAEGRVGGGIARMDKEDGAVILRVAHRVSIRRESSLGRGSRRLRQRQQRLKQLQSQQLQLQSQQLLLQVQMQLPPPSEEEEPLRPKHLNLCRNPSGEKYWLRESAIGELL